MGNMRSVPETNKTTSAFKTSDGIVVGMSCMTGYRLTMEDGHIHDEIAPGVLLLGVFDGHGGEQTALFAEKEFTNIMKPHILNYLQNNAEKSIEDQIEDLKTIFTSGFQEFDEAFANSTLPTLHTSSGSTAVVTLITPKFILCANIGDSRSILCNESANESTIALSNDHKPGDEVELKRIHDAGGFVQFDRVDSELALSRAFGDFRFKLPAKKPTDPVPTFFSYDSFNVDPTKCKVTCVPSFIHHIRNEDDQYLIIACDGVWDVFSNENAIKFVNTCIQQDGITDVGKLCELLIDESLNTGSKDNLSALMVVLPSSNFVPTFQDKYIHIEPSVVMNSSEEIDV